MTTIEEFLRKADEVIEIMDLYNELSEDIHAILRQFVVDRNATGLHKDDGWENSYSHDLYWDPDCSYPGVIAFRCSDRDGDTISVNLPHEYILDRDAWVAERLASLIDQAHNDYETWQASQIASKVLEAQERQDEAQNLLDRLTELTGHVYVPIEATR